MKSSERRALILRLLDECVVETQEDILNLLKKEGIDTTQATVSRDIKKLNLVKTVDSKGHYRYLSVSGSSNQGEETFAFLHSAIKNVDYSQNNVVIRCGTGMAQAICAGLDQINHDNVLGTVAGDDTILVITRSTDASEEFVRYLKDRIGR